MSEIAERGIPVCSETNCCESPRYSRVSLRRSARAFPSASVVLLSVIESSISAGTLPRDLPYTLDEAARGSECCARLLVVRKTDIEAFLKADQDLDRLE